MPKHGSFIMAALWLVPMSRNIRLDISPGRLIPKLSHASVEDVFPSHLAQGANASEDLRSLGDARIAGLQAFPLQAGRNGKKTPSSLG